MSITRQMTITRDASERINALAKTLAVAMHGKNKIECELALLLAYCTVADGVQAMSEATRQKRASMIVSAASTAMCEIIAHVAEIDDSQFQVMAPACHE